MEPKEEEEKHEAPEGGWGWIVCMAYALNNMIIIPGFQIFSLLYHNVFVDNGMYSEMSVVVSINSAFGMLLGLFNGVILGTFSYRKVAITGALIMFAGNFLTSQSTSFIEFLMFYSVLVSIGANLVMSAFTLALNTYFVQKRGMATGIAMTATGIGPILMPWLMQALMTYYGGAKYPGLIVAALSLHSLLGALLLQPVKWHIKPKVHVKAPIIKGNKADIKELIPLKEMNGETSLLKTGVDDKMDGNVQKDQEADSTDKKSKYLEEKEGKGEKDDKEDKDQLEGQELLEYPRDKIPTKKTEESVRGKSNRKPFAKFNFQLFNDPGYVFIIIGLSLAFVGEMNFSLMIPSVLQSMKYGHGDAATLMIVIACADISSRFTTPFLNKYSRKYARLIFTLSLIFGLFAKFAIVVCQESFAAMFIVAICLGIAKGFRSVYMTLIIPNYVSLDLLPSATGFQMCSNGLALGIMGKVFGVIIDNYGNNAWIYTINCFTSATIILWTVEYFLMKKKTKRKPSQRSRMNV